MAGENNLPIIQVDAQSPLPLGTAVILTEPFPSSITLAEGHSLATMLSEKGWNVIISPFHLPLKEPSDDTDSNEAQEPNKDTAQIASIHPRSNSLSQHADFNATQGALQIQLNALNNFIKDRQGYRLYIAQGMVAAAYISATREQPSLYPDTFVAISPFWPELAINNQVVEHVAQSEFPVLDLSLSNFNGWATITHERRRISAKNALKLHYRQINIPNNSSYFSMTPNQKSPYIQLVANNTIGWTRHLGW
ncbi:hypothetical protein D210916BOD24_02770 [Alteromonas sp. D210916BOD_24]